MSESVKFKDFFRTFKAMYKQIQALSTEQKALVVTLNCSKRNFNEFQTVLSDMNTLNQFNKMSVLNVKQFQKISIN